jgi:hypothetical protein
MLSFLVRLLRERERERERERGRDLERKRERERYRERERERGREREDFHIERAASKANENMHARFIYAFSTQCLDLKNSCCSV